MHRKAVGLLDMDRAHAARITAPSIAMIAAVSCLNPVSVAVAADEKAGILVEEVVVTARRTEEVLEDVPLAIRAIDPQTMAEMNITSELGLQAATPGLLVRQTARSSDMNFALRGQSIDSFSYSAPAVTTYFNEVQAGGSLASSFFDFASIQVLKGPQGTLFGRNATGGAVLYSSRRPTEEFEGYAKAGYGNYDNIELEGVVNVPFSQGFAMRLAGKSQDRDGYQKNLLNGEKLGEVDSKVGRISLLVAPPGSNFENLLVYQHGRFQGSNTTGKIANVYGLNGFQSTYFDPITGTVRPLTTNMAIYYGPGGLNPGAVPGFTDLGDFLQRQESLDYYDVYLDRSNKHDSTQNFVSNATTFEFSDALKLKNVFGYNKVDSYNPVDIDGSPYQFLTIGGGVGKDNDGYTTNTKQWSNETQLLGQVGQMEYIMGVYFSKEEGYNRIPLCIGCDTLFFGPPVGFFAGQYDFTNTDKSKAVFAQINYALTDRLNMTVGARYTWEKVKIENGADSNLILLGVNAEDERSDSEPSWLVGLDFKLTDDWLLYITQRGSWRTGGFNGTSNNSAPDNDTFKPEKTYDVEVGAKFAGMVLGRPARLNVALYDQIVEDAQRAPYINISAVAGNVEEAEIKGLELDGSFSLLQWLELGVSYAYTDAEFSKPEANVGGNEFIFGPYGDVPKHAGSAYFRATHDLASDLGELVLRGDVYSQSSFYFSNLADTIFPGTKIDGYTTVNGRVEWNTIMGSKVSASAYVRNIADEEYAVGGFPLGQVIGSNAVLPGMPRTYGIEVSVDF